MRKYCNHTSEQKKTNETHFMKIGGNSRNLEMFKEEMDKFHEITK